MLIPMLTPPLIPPPETAKLAVARRPPPSDVSPATLPMLSQHLLDPLKRDPSHRPIAARRLQFQPFVYLSTPRSVTGTIGRQAGR